MKKTAMGLTAFLLSVCLCACSSASSNTEKSGVNLKSESASDAIYYETSASEGNEGNITVSDSTASIDSKIERKIIKNASLSAKTKDIDNCYAEILQSIKDNGGYESSKDMSTYDEDYKRITATFQVPPEKLDTVIEFIQNNCNVINCNITSDDITAEYTDTQIRLDNKKRLLKKYYEYYEKATNMDETLRLENEIANITAEIERYEGQIKMWNTLTSQSEIVLNLQQENDPQVVKKKVDWNAISFSTMGDLMYNGFITVSNTIVSIIQWLLIIVVSILPLIAIFFIVFFVTRHIVKNKRKKAADKKSKEVSVDNNINKPYNITESDNKNP